MNRTLPIVVLGAGPKACSIWAKYKSLCDDGVALTPLTVIEKDRVAANWAGASGYTDGLQSLVSPSEQDIGFPYSNVAFGPDLSSRLTQRMFRYSWQNYLLSVGGYPEWVAQDRPRAPHYQFRDYLDWVARSSQMQPIKREIVQISVNDQDFWELRNSGSQDSTPASGLVITGNGKPRMLKGQPQQHARIFDGESFWPSRDQFDDVEFARIAVIGAGETAAAIACNILDHIENRANSVIELICKQYAYFTRAEVSKDLLYFSNPSTWSSLREGRRFSIMRRADRGVVSAGIKRRLEESDLVEYTTADAESITVTNSDELLLSLRYGGETEQVPYQYIIVATGFDSLWFFELFDERTKLRLVDCVIRQLTEPQKQELQMILEREPDSSSWLESLKRADARRFFERSMERLIDEDLSLRGFLPKLHVPMLAGLSQGPGFPNLNCLGLLSDRILKSYLI